VLGTLVGLAGGIWLAGLTAGHTPWILVVIVASMFCGFCLLRVSYAYMIFFITIMVAQLYSVLNEVSDHLLVLRLEETGIGAAAGIAVALLVAPLSTRDTVAAAQSTLLTTLAELLDVLRITKQSLARVLKELIDKGYVESRPGVHDRRQKTPLPAAGRPAPGPETQRAAV